LELDIKVQGGRVYDGTGNPWFGADIGIRGDRIVAVADLRNVPARRTIEASGRVVCPGFIDLHSHSDLTLFRHRFGLGSLLQGITTQVTGNCGHSLAPVRDGKALLGRLLGNQAPSPWSGPTAKAPEREPGVEPWTTFAGYLEAQERLGLGINMAPLVGHGTVRRYVLGPEGEGGERTDLGDAELRDMGREVRLAMEAGAFGLSSGLEYPPGRNAKTAELVELCRIVASCDGLYATHMRSEGQAPRMEWLGAIVEAIDTGRLSGVRTNIAHLKADQRDAWGKTAAALRLLDDARRSGVEITADVYPYPFAAVGYLYGVLPPALADEGLVVLLQRLSDPATRQAIRQQLQRGVPDWTNPALSFGWGSIGIVETTCPDDVGKSIEDLARERQSDPLDVCFDLLLADNGLTRSSVGVMSEENIRMKLQHPLTMVSTDGTTVDEFAGEIAGGDLPPEKLHPRSTGTYPRLFGRFVREMGALTLAEAIRKCTSLPATVARIQGRGLITEGAFADLVVFDPAEIAPTGTFTAPHQHPSGIAFVLVNGGLAVESGRPTRILAGRVLRHACP
jgi:N-acyl-D-aspartate/D-glutamate deacylase